ncbi:MAG: hypothetical protein J6C85_03635 [Alphaproteobacteria bacterium]|nr:hypothetical protein [Alphaproteobacteria bacterium]
MKQDILAKKINILKQRTRHFMLTYGMTGLALGTPLCFGCQNDKIQQNKTETKKDTIVTVKPVEIKNPVATIAYYTDTLHQATSTLLMYNKGKIIRYYVENHGSFYLKLPYVVHEDWHRHNFKSGFKVNSKLSPYEYYKLCIQDEMTANLAAILTARYEYLCAKDKKAVINKYENTYMGFYFKAIKEKKFIPQAVAISFQERAFLANGVKKMWLETYYEHYAPKLYRMIPRYIERRDLYPSNHILYKKYVSFFWTIGGIDFSKYLESDIDEKRDEQVMMAEDMKDVKSFKKDAPFLVQNITGNMPKLRNFAPQDQEQALLHLVISAKLKSALKDKDESVLKHNRLVLSETYNKVMFELVRDSSLYRFLDTYAFVAQNRFNVLEKTENLEGKLKSFYVYKNVDLSRQIKNFTLLESLKPKNGFDDSIAKFYFWPDLTSYKQDKTDFPIDENKTNEDIAALHGEKEVWQTTQSNIKYKRQRISKAQYIDIPNFWEPILTDAKPEDTQAILTMIEKFNEIPAVLKSCNTAEIKQYKQEHNILEQVFSSNNQAIR